MFPVLAPTLSVVPQADLEKHLASLETTLAPGKTSDARARLRSVYEWAADHGKDITIDVLNAIPGGSAGVPIFKVVLGIAMLRRGARDADAACDMLRERLLDIYEQSYELRQSKEESIDGKMDVIFNKFVTSKWLRGIKKASTMDLLTGLTSDIKRLQEEVPALRRIAGDVKSVAVDIKTVDQAGIEDVVADVKTIKVGFISPTWAHILDW
ncbi:hypothetical protein RQP46_008739 [Phenoliferia psychrophenolica]